MFNFNNIVSNISSKMPTDFLPGAVSGGILGRELLIKSLSWNTNEEDSALKVGAKTVANFAVRSSSIAFSPYNPVSLYYLTAFTNPLMAIGKGYQACSLYIHGKVYDDERMIDEAKKKTLEVAAHVALSVFDHWTLGLVNSSKIFDIAAAGYTLVGTALDIARSSEKVHDKLFDPDFIPSDDDSDDEDSYDSAVSSGDEGFSSGDGDLFVEGGFGGFSARDSSGVHDPDSDYVEGDFADELASEDEASDTPSSSGSRSPTSPIGGPEIRFINGVRVDDSCRERKTLDGKQLRDSSVLHPPSRFFSP
jgi:hypothetical protein